MVLKWSLDICPVAAVTSSINEQKGMAAVNDYQDEHAQHHENQPWHMGTLERAKQEDCSE